MSGECLLAFHPRDHRDYHFYHDSTVVNAEVAIHACIDRKSGALPRDYHE